MDTKNTEAQGNTPPKPSTRWSTRSPKPAILLTIIGILALAVAVSAFFITKSIMQPPTPKDPLVEQGRIPADQTEDEITKALSKVTKPGTTIKEGESADVLIGIDYDTNKPIISDVSITRVEEVDPRKVPGRESETPMFEDQQGRIWYVEVEMTVNPKPSDNTKINIPLGITNAKNPGDADQIKLFDDNNPSCNYGPDKWGDVKGNTVKKCVTIVTFENNDLGKLLATNLAFEPEKHIEFYTKSPEFLYTAKSYKK